MGDIFTGIKVLDLTKVFSGPFATRMLADYGAEVIKIESPDNPDDSRFFPPIKNEWSGYFEVLNRNKKGISLNLKEESDLQKFYDLCKNADVFVENLTPSTKRKLKIDYETVKELNPNIVYASLSGHGQSSDKKYYDVIAQAESGLMSLTGTVDTPMKIGPGVVDAFSGLTLAFAIAGALLYRERTGEGQCIDVAMLGCAMNLLESNLIDYSLTKVDPPRTGNKDNLISPFGAYRAQDGYIAIAVGNNNLWGKLLSFLKTQMEFKNENLFSTNLLRLENNEGLTEILENAFSHFTVSDLEMKLSDIGIPCSSVNKMSDVASSKLNFEREFLVKANHSLLGEHIIPGKSIQFSKGEKSMYHSAPSIGQDNGEYGI